MKNLVLKLNAIHMLVVLNQVVRRVPKATLINASRTVVVHDALNQVARRVPKAKPRNAKHTVVDYDVLNQVA